MTDKKKYFYKIKGYKNYNPVSVTVKAEEGSRRVYGSVTSDNGEKVTFRGWWVGSGKVAGYDKNGKYYNFPYKPNKKK